MQHSMVMLKQHAHYGLRRASLLELCYTTVDDGVIDPHKNR